MDFLQTRELGKGRLVLVNAIDPGSPVAQQRGSQHQGKTSAHIPKHDPQRKDPNA